MLKALSSLSHPKSKEELGRSIFGGIPPMLVLTRKKKESIVINSNIVVTVVEIIGKNKVRLGIEAPPNIPVDREEVHKRRQEGFQDEEPATS